MIRHSIVGLLETDTFDRRRDFDHEANSHSGNASRTNISLIAPCAVMNLGVRYVLLNNVT